MYHARSLAEVFEKGTALVAENEVELGTRAFILTIILTLAFGH
jgi:hypothetical protein